MGKSPSEKNVYGDKETRFGYSAQGDLSSSSWVTLNMAQTLLEVPAHVMRPDTLSISIGKRQHFLYRLYSIVYAEI